MTGVEAEDFEALVGPHRRELYAHCYRMLGSVQDAEDALQEALLAAWKGLTGFQERSSLRAWLYRVTTNVCLRFIQRRPPRLLSPDAGPPRDATDDLGEAVTGPVWIEPWPDDTAGSADPAEAYARRETVELAFVAALQHLPRSQRAVLILREVLGFSAAEVAEALETTPASVNSALQRARRTLDERAPATSQAEALDALGADGVRELVDAFVVAWENADVPALTALLAQDARFTMPPLPAWFDGREAVVRFLRHRVFATPWRLVPMRCNGQPAFACYQGRDGDDALRLGAINVLSLTDGGRIAEITGFLDPELHRFLGISHELR